MGCKLPSTCCLPLDNCIKSGRGSIGRSPRRHWYFIQSFRSGKINLVVFIACSDINMFTDCAFRFTMVLCTHLNRFASIYFGRKYYSLLLVHNYGNLFSQKFEHGLWLAVRPEFTGVIAIKGGRHPILDADSTLKGALVPNDTYCCCSTYFQLIQGAKCVQKTCLNTSYFR